MDSREHGFSRDRNQGIWIEHSDRLYVAAYSSVASLVVQFSGYFRKMNGEVIEYAVIVNPTSDRAVTEGNQFFGAGFLLSCVATLASGNASRGQCYVRAMVQRSTGTPMVKLHNVLGGYVTDDYSPSFPYGKIEGPLEGPGNLRSITGTDPAAGSEMSESVPTGARWRLHGVQVVMVADANVANRQVVLKIDDGTNLLFSAGATVNQTASQSNRMYFASYGTEDTSNSSALLNFIPVTTLLLPGWRIRTITDNLQVGDNFGAPQLAVEEWIEA